MGKRKKKHVQTEKERLFQEEAAQKRAEKAEAERKRRRKELFVLPIIAAVMLALSAIFFGIHLARMRNFELNYTKAYGTVTGFERHHDSGSRGSSYRYTLVISYTCEGRTYTLHDSASYPVRPDDMEGEKVEIYVDPVNPAKAKKASTADDFSVVSVFIFGFSIPFTVFGAALVVQERGGGFFMRLAVIWLPVVAACLAAMLLCWVGFPGSSFGTAFVRTDGALGYAILSGLSLLAMLTDAIITKRLNVTRARR